MGKSVLGASVIEFSLEFLIGDTYLIASELNIMLNEMIHWYKEYMTYINLVV